MIYQSAAELLLLNMSIALPLTILLDFFAAMLSCFDNISLFKDLLKRMILQDTYEEVQYLNTASKLCNVLSENMKKDFPFLIRIPVRIFNLIT